MSRHKNRPAPLDTMAQLHDIHTKEISIHPHRFFDLGELVLSTGESNLLVHRNTIGQPDDLVFDPTTHTLYNIEYKCSNKQRQHAQHQLHRAEDYLKDIFPSYNIKNIYVHENYKIEEVK